MRAQYAPSDDVHANDVNVAVPNRNGGIVTAAETRQRFVSKVRLLFQMIVLPWNS